MKPDIRPAQSDEPAVHSPELRRLVALAQDRPAPRSRLDADAIHAAYLAARAGQRRRLAGLAGLAVAAALAGVVVSRLDLGLSRETGPIGHVAENMAPGPGLVTPVQPLGPVLAAGVRVVAVAADTPSPTVLGAWDVGLADGRYVLEVDEHAGPEVLRARSAGGTVELRHGRVQVVVGAARVEATLEHGVGEWVAQDGAREPLMSPAAVEPSEPSEPTAGTPIDEPVDVSALARRAERLLTAGKREPAIKLLTQIVTTHPEHPTARGALLDLGPLLKASGRTDEARCAYRLYLERYPGKRQLADQVEKALNRLGDGPACRGLKPR